MKSFLPTNTPEKIKLAFWKLTSDFAAIIKSLQEEQFNPVFISNYGLKRKSPSREFDSLLFFSLLKENVQLNQQLNNFITENYGLTYDEYLKKLFFTEELSLYKKLNLKIYEKIKNKFPYEMSQSNYVNILVGKFLLKSTPQVFTHVLNDNLDKTLDIKTMIDNRHLFIYESLKKTNLRLKALIDANLVDADNTEHIDTFLQLFQDHKKTEFLNSYFNLPSQFNPDFFEKHPNLIKFKQYADSFTELDLKEIKDIDKVYYHINQVDAKLWKKLVKNNSAFFNEEKNLLYFFQYIFKNHTSSRYSNDSEKKINAIFEIIIEKEKLENFLFIPNLFTFNNTSLSDVEESVLKQLIMLSKDNTWQISFETNFETTQNQLIKFFQTIAYSSTEQAKEIKDKLLNIAIDNGMDIFSPIINDYHSLLERYNSHRDIDSGNDYHMPYELYNKVIGLLTEEKLKTTIKGGVKVAQILFSQNIDVLKIMSEKNIDPLLDEKVPLELIANAPNFEKIPQSVIDFYVGQTTTEQLLAPRSNSFDRTNVSYYLSMQPKLFDIYFKDDSLFKLLSEENKINIVNNFLSYPQEKSAEYLLNDKFDWPWEKSDVSYYRNNFFSFNEELKEKIEQKVEYIKAAQEKQKLENLFNDDIIIKEKEPIIPSKPKKRNKI